jgi:iron complex transport system substrate-binding protein
VNAELAKNNVWKSIPAVADGRAYAFPEGIWTFGGPQSAGQVLDAYVGLLTK